MCIYLNVNNISVLIINPQTDKRVTNMQKIKQRYPDPNNVFSSYIMKLATKCECIGMCVLNHALLELVLCKLDIYKTINKVTPINKMRPNVKSLCSVYFQTFM